MKYAKRLSARVVKDLDGLDDKIKKRMLGRIAETLDQAHQPGRARRSRVAGGRIIFLVDEKAKTLSVVTIERRGQPRLRGGRAVDKPHFSLVT